MKVLAVDIGGTNVKILATGQTESRKFPSGPTLTPRKMVAEVKKLAERLEIRRGLDRLPGAGRRRPARRLNRAISAAGWVGFDFAKAFGCPREGHQRRGDAGPRELQRRQRCCSSASGPASGPP